MAIKCIHIENNKEFNFDTGYGLFLDGLIGNYDGGFNALEQFSSYLESKQVDEVSSKFKERSPFVMDEVFLIFQRNNNYTNTKKVNSMKTYFLIEKQNANSQRDSVEFQASNLTQAKRKATSLQFFSGTYLEVLDSNGLTVAAKDTDGKWLSDSYFE